MRLLSLLPSLLLAGTSFAAPVEVHEDDKRAGANTPGKVTTIRSSGTFSLPAGASQGIYYIEAVGGQGGSGLTGLGGTPTTGGYGGYASAQYTLYPNIVYTVTVGGRGLDSANTARKNGGGGGGGASTFGYFQNGNNQFYIIGAGGGGGGSGANGASVTGTGPDNDGHGAGGGGAGGGGGGAGKASFTPTNYAGVGKQHGDDGNPINNNNRADSASGGQGGVNGGGGGGNSVGAGSGGGGGGAGWQGGKGGDYNLGGDAGRSYVSPDYANTLVAGTGFLSDQHDQTGNGFVRITAPDGPPRTRPTPRA